MSKDVWIGERNLLPIDVCRTREQKLPNFPNAMATKSQFETEDMSRQQEASIARLQDALRIKRGITMPLRNCGSNASGFLFTEVNGVTVTIGPRGGYGVPAIRRYPETGKPGETALDAAVYADEFWEKQQKQGNFETGHDGPLVHPDGTCRSSTCPCQREKDDQRMRRNGFAR